MASEIVASSADRQEPVDKLALPVVYFLQGRLLVEDALSSPYKIRADESLLRILLSNLISNAAEYSPENGQVSLRLDQQDGADLLCISNSAPLLNARDIGHLFERFWRLDKARGDSGHSGLGLSIAKTCAGLLGWRIWAELSDDALLSLKIQFQDRPEA